MSTNARSQFFFWMPAVLLAILLVGFSPSFYLRGLMPLPDVRGADPLAMPLPVLFIAHGMVLTVWYALLFAQAALIRSGNTNWHRRLGWLGAATAVCVVASAVAVVVSMAPRGQRGAVAMQFSVTSIGVLLVAFVVLVAAAILLRKRAPVHKRLMLAASVCILAPALGRFTNSLAALGIAPTLASTVAQFGGPIVLFLLLALIIVHDRRTLHRITAATWASVLLLTPAIALWFSGL